MSFWGAVAGAGVSAAGQLLANSANIANQRRLWTEQIELANSAHQREVDDLRSAGLNPILSAQGSGASTPNPEAVTQENVLSSASQIVDMESRAKQADAAERMAENGSWIIYDAKSLGSAGFEVMGVGMSGQSKRISTIRINKVTGETYDALTGRRVRVVGEMPVNSAVTTPPVFDAGSFVVDPDGRIHKRGHASSIGDSFTEEGAREYIKHHPRVIHR